MSRGLRRGGTRMSDPRPVRAVAPKPSQTPTWPTCSPHGGWGHFRGAVSPLPRSGLWLRLLQLGDHHDAEDATERTFLAALRALHTFRDEGSSFHTCLFRITHHNTIANTSKPPPCYACYSFGICSQSHARAYARHGQSLVNYKLADHSSFIQITRKTLSNTSSTAPGKVGRKAWTISFPLVGGNITALH